MTTTKFRYEETTNHYRAPKFVPDPDHEWGGEYVDPGYGTTHVDAYQPVRASWEFEDGVTVDMRTACLLDERRDFIKKARVYTRSDQPFSVVEDLTNRFRRPYMIWKDGVINALDRVGVPFDKVRWDQRAGCSCGCSPGFVVEGGPKGVEFWITLPLAPTVDETKPGREVLV